MNNLIDGTGIMRIGLSICWEEAFARRVVDVKSMGQYVSSVTRMRRAPGTAINRQAQLLLYLKHRWE
jgi:hypothetical protein